MPTPDAVRLENLLRRAVEDDPIVGVASDVGDTACYFCGWFDTWREHPDEHAPDCTWVEARRELGMPHDTEARS